MFTLKNILKANAVSCILFGAIFLIIPEDTINFLSTDNPMPDLVLMIIGIILVANGLHLIWESTKEFPSKIQVFIFSIGDFLWVVASVFLILGGYWVTTTNGIIVSLVIAVVVGFFGTVQFLEARKLSAS